MLEICELLAGVRVSKQAMLTLGKATMVWVKDYVKIHSAKIGPWRANIKKFVLDFDFGQSCKGDNYKIWQLESIAARFFVQILASVGLGKD